MKEKGALNSLRESVPSPLPSSLPLLSHPFPNPHYYISSFHKAISKTFSKSIRWHIRTQTWSFDPLETRVSNLVASALELPHLAVSSALSLNTTPSPLSAKPSALALISSTPLRMSPPSQ